MNTSAIESEDILTISLDSNSDEEQDPLRLTPPPATATVLKPTPNGTRRIVVNENFVTICPVSVLEKCIHVKVPQDRKDIKCESPAVTVLSFPRPRDEAVSIARTRDSKDKKRASLVTLKPEPSTSEIIEVNLVDDDDEDDQPVLPNTTLFQTFTDICYQCEKSDDMEKIMNKKMARRFAHANPGYLASPSFKMLLEGKIANILNDPANVYTHIFDVNNELKARSMRTKTRGNTKTVKNGSNCGKPSTSKEQDEIEVDDADNDMDCRTREKLRNMDKILLKLQKAIKKLEEKEVDWDDEDDSTYMQLQRYKKRAWEVHEYIGKLTREKTPGYRTRVVCNTQFAKVNSCLEKYVNKTGCFPDFADIYKLIDSCNKEESLNLSNVQLYSLASNTFEHIGNQLQRHRQNMDWNMHSVFLEGNADPADDDPELCAKLKENKIKGETRLEELLVSFVKKQEEQKLEPVEVTDEDGNSSVKDSDEDEDDDDEEDEEDDEVDIPDKADISDKENNDAVENGGDEARKCVVDSLLAPDENLEPLSIRHESPSINASAQSLTNEAVIVKSEWKPEAMDTDEATKNSFDVVSSLNANSGDTMNGATERLAKNETNCTDVGVLNMSQITDTPSVISSSDLVEKLPSTIDITQGRASLKPTANVAPTTNHSFVRSSEMKPKMSVGLHSTSSSNCNFNIVSTTSIKHSVTTSVNNSGVVKILTKVDNAERGVQEEHLTVITTDNEDGSNRKIRVRSFGGSGHFSSSTGVVKKPRMDDDVITID